MRNEQINTALDTRKVINQHNGSVRQCPVNPQQAALSFGSAIKAAISVIGTYDIVDNGFGSSVGVSNNDFVQHVGFNVPAYFTWADMSGYTGQEVTVTCLKSGLWWVHLHTDGVLTGDGLNPKQLFTQIRQTGSVIDSATFQSVSLLGSNGICNGEASGLFAVVAGDELTCRLAGNYPDVSLSPVDVRFEVMQIY
jgi:hypothetical protein